jgi:hypothetical protein
MKEKKPADPTPSQRISDLGGSFMAFQQAVTALLETSQNKEGIAKIMERLDEAIETVALLSLSKRLDAVEIQLRTQRAYQQSRDYLLSVLRPRPGASE